MGNCFGKVTEEHSNAEYSEVPRNARAPERDSFRNIEYESNTWREIYATRPRINQAPRSYGTTQAQDPWSYDPSQKNMTIPQSNKNLQLQQHTVPIKQLVRDNKIMRDILRTFQGRFCELSLTNICSRKLLDTLSKEYNFVASKLTRNDKFNKNYIIASIIRIWNPYLFTHYMLRKQYSQPCKELYLFHGTKEEYLDNILLENLNWRKIVHKKFGLGVSFGNNPWYASHYSKRNKSDNGVMVMILAKVLIGKKCMGNPFMEVPHPGYDTTTNHDEQVLVKYDDNTFYPEFVVYFVER